MGGKNSFSLGILVRFQEHPSTPPSKRSSTKIVAQWSQQHIPVIYLSPASLFLEDGQLWGKGWFPDLKKDRWQMVTLPIRSLFNRFPTQHAPDAINHAAILANRTNTPFANHPAFQGLVWDKKKTGQVLENAGLRTPTIYTMEECWENTIQQTQTLYIKPRFGAFGKGIRILHKTERDQFECEDSSIGTRYQLAPEQLRKEQEQTDKSEELLIQQAIEPPFEKLRGFCVRSLVQQSGDGIWQSLARVARISNDDPIANVARGAQAIPLDDLCQQHWGQEQTQTLRKELDELDRAVPDALLQQLPLLSRQNVLEMGIDYLIDSQRRPWILEINGFPQGKLEHLAHLSPHRFLKAYEQVHTNPLQTLLYWSTQSTEKKNDHKSI